MNYILERITNAKAQVAVATLFQLAGTLFPQYRWIADLVTGALASIAVHTAATPTPDKRPTI